VYQLFGRKLGRLKWLTPLASDHARRIMHLGNRRGQLRYTTIRCRETNPTPANPFSYPPYPADSDPFATPPVWPGGGHRSRCAARPVCPCCSPPICLQVAACGFWRDHGVCWGIFGRAGPLAGTTEQMPNPAMPALSGHVRTRSAGCRDVASKAVPTPSLATTLVSLRFVLWPGRLVNRGCRELLVSAISVRFQLNSTGAACR